MKLDGVLYTDLFEKWKYEKLEEMEKGNNKMKKYKTWEAMKMLTENHELKFKDENGIILEASSIFNDFYCEFKFGGGLTFNLLCDWELIQEPVIFDEVLWSTKKCKVKHEILEEFEKEFPLEISLKVIKEFNDFDDYMYSLSNILDKDQLKKVIKFGKWYLEEK